MLSKAYNLQLHGMALKYQPLYTKALYKCKGLTTVYSKICITN